MVVNRLSRRARPLSGGADCGGRGTVTSGLQPGDDAVDVCGWTVLAQFRLGFHPADHDFDTHDRAQLPGDEPNELGGAVLAGVI